MPENQSNRRCPQCGTSGRMFRSHSRNHFEKLMHFLSGVIYKYRCHQCNWRGYMFRAFPTQKRFGFWILVSGCTSLCLIAVAMFALIYRR